MAASDHGNLTGRLAAALPRDLRFRYHHVATPPSSCAALYSPPPGCQPERTTCESHMLNVSVSPSKDFERDIVSVFAIEVFIYRTQHLTTLFVSKADTTGWLSLLQVPAGQPSIIKTLSSTFTSYLIRKCHRPDRRLVLSLFARAQSQYLYPGSDENPKKHILDDRQLVKWWCRTLDPVLREYEGQEHIPLDDKDTDELDAGNESQVHSRAYLIVPGHDRYETAAFFPASAKKDASDDKRWLAGHPLRELATFPNAPPRCLVPHFPDDPKARFLLDLDVELKDAPPTPSSSQSQSQSSQTNSQSALLNPQESPSKRGRGQWKSVKTLEQFWDMMGFRQECSSGRLVGFLWVVFTPDSLEDHDGNDQDNNTGRLRLEKQQIPTLARPDRKSQVPLKNSSLAAEVGSNTDTPAIATPNTGKRLRKRITRKPVARLRRRKGRLTGVIVTRPPRIKQAATGAMMQKGTLVLPSRAYARVHELLLRLDFASVTVARQSTLKWIREASILAGRGATSGDWGVDVVGKATMPASNTNVSLPQSSDAQVTVLNTKRKAPLDEARDITSQQNGANGNEAVNVLSIGALRKKPKTDGSLESAPVAQQQTATTTMTSTTAGTEAAADEVRTLGASLIRKRPKAAAEA